MDAIIKSACGENIKNSSFKNYKSISIKLFNIINKNKYNENMKDEEIMIGFGKVVNKFHTLKNYLDDGINCFKTTTKKNYINNLLNVILKINNINNYCIKKKNALNQIKTDIKEYWCNLRQDLDTINIEKKKIKEQNELEKNNNSEEEEEEQLEEEKQLKQLEEEKEEKEDNLEISIKKWIINKEIKYLEQKIKSLYQDINNL